MPVTAGRSFSRPGSIAPGKVRSTTVEKDKSKNDYQIKITIGICITIDFTP